MLLARVYDYEKQIVEKEKLAKRREIVSCRKCRASSIIYLLPLCHL